MYWYFPLFNIIMINIVRQCCEKNWYIQIHWPIARVILTAKLEFLWHKNFPSQVKCFSETSIIDMHKTQLLIVYLTEVRIHSIFCNMSDPDLFFGGTHKIWSSMIRVEWFQSGFLLLYTPPDSLCFPTLLVDHCLMTGSKLLILANDK